MTAHAEILHLREENAALRRALDDRAPTEFDPRYRLTLHQQRVLRIFLRKRFATRDEIMDDVYYDGQDFFPRVVDVTLSRIRTKLRPLGIRFTNRRDRKGWEISDEEHAALLTALRP